MIKKRSESKSYRNFNLSIYCPVGSAEMVENEKKLEENFSKLEKHLNIGHVYIECFRGQNWTDKATIIKAKEFFEKRGIRTSGGITTCDASDKMGFVSLCYSNPEHVEILRRSVELCSEVFDEFIFDDFYFLNCRCEKCVENRGNRTWDEFRLEQKKYLTEEVVLKTAKATNPNVNAIVKFPNWFEDFPQAGYDLGYESEKFDSIYTGTETRNPMYAAQHLPKYLGYFIMRYFDDIAPGKNLGGWFDPYDCTYNLTSYLEQAYMTVYAKAEEVTLFCLQSLMVDSTYSTFVPALGQLFRDVDEYMSELGNPVGVKTYRPIKSIGEKNLHSYLGMCGIAFDPVKEYPKDASCVFLSEGAAYDENILDYMEETMLAGGDVVVTSGFVKVMGRKLDRIANVIYNGNKAFVDTYADSRDNGVSLRGHYKGEKRIIIPQLEFGTNDVWALAAAFGEDNNFPVVLKCNFGRGTFGIVTIPDDMGDLYNYPKEVLTTIRQMMKKSMPVTLNCSAKVMQICYDNDVIILRSNLEYVENVEFEFNKEVNGCVNMQNNRQIEIKDNKAKVELLPGVSYILKMN